MRKKFAYFGFLIALIIFLLVGYLLYNRTNKLFESVYEVVHTHLVVQKIDEIHSDLKDLESSQRGYVVSGIDKYLKPYYEIHDEILGNINELKALTYDNPVQQENIKSLVPLILKKRNFIDTIINLKKSGDEQKTLELIKSMRGIALMDDVTKQIDKMKTEEFNLLTVRSDNARKTFQDTLNMSLSGAGISIMILLIIFAFLLKEIKFRKNTESKLEEEKMKLEISESEVKANRTLLKSVIDSIGDGILVVDNEGRFEVVNPAAEKILGENLINKKHAGIFSNFESYLEDGETPYPVEQFRVKKNENSFSGDIVCIKNKTTNNKLWLNLNFKILTDETAGKKSGLFAFRDITAERISGEKIRESETLLQNILDRLPVGVFIVDSEGNIMKENSAALEIWQGNKFIETKKYANRKGWSVKSGECIGDEDWAMTKAFKKGEISKDEEIEIECHDGTHKFILSSAFPIYNKAGKIINAVEVNYNITRIKEDENEIIKLNNQLQSNYIQLTNLHRELEAFSYSVSHDLRAPLRHLQGYSDLLKKQLLKIPDEKSNHYVEKISSSAKEMGQLIEDLLIFSRLGRSELKVVDINMDILTGEVIYDLKKENNDRKIKWNIKRLPVIKGDYFLIKTVIVNLISNAVKFTSRKEVAEIQFGYEDKEKDYEFFIKDNGAGFNMEYYDKLFGVFQRLHSKQEFEGTGIGLASVKRIITRHGGSIYADAKENEGATFYFKIPKIV